MIHPPKTLAEARAYRYRRWAGNPNGDQYDPARCAMEVWDCHMAYQCQRRNGHGPEELYCRQHARTVEARSPGDGG